MPSGNRNCVPRSLIPTSVSTVVDGVRRVDVFSCGPESAISVAAQAVVVVDVIRSTTTGITALENGHRCFVAATEREAWDLAASLDRAILAGEQNGFMPDGFEMNNSPVSVAAADPARPVILLSTSGTRIMRNVESPLPVYAACLRNVAASVAYLAGRYASIALVGAETSDEFRTEDQICCGRLADRLVNAGYESLPRARDAIRRWSAVSINAIAEGRSAEYLRRTRQDHDLDFILEHVDDVGCAARLDRTELVPLESGAGS